MLSEKDIADEADPASGIPRLSPDFLIETYLDHQVSLRTCPLTSCSHASRTLHKHISIDRDLLLIPATGRTILPHLRCQFHDLPIKSHGPIRHDFTGPYYTCKPLQCRIPQYNPIPTPILLLFSSSQTETIHPDIQIPSLT